jgi:hypothetical protein
MPPITAKDGSAASNPISRKQRKMAKKKALEEKRQEASKDRGEL